MPVILKSYGFYYAQNKTDYRELVAIVNEAEGCSIGHRNEKEWLERPATHTGRVSQKE